MCTPPQVEHASSCSSSLPPFSSKVPSASSSSSSSSPSSAAAASFLFLPADPCFPYRDAASEDASSRCGALRTRPLEVNAGGDDARAGSAARSSFATISVCLRFADVALSASTAGTAGPGLDAAADCLDEDGTVMGEQVGHSQSPGGTRCSGGTRHCWWKACSQPGPSQSSIALLLDVCTPRHVAHVSSSSLLSPSLPSSSSLESLCRASIAIEGDVSPLPPLKRLRPPSAPLHPTAPLNAMS